MSESAEEPTIDVGVARAAPLPGVARMGMDGVPLPARIGMYRIIVLIGGGGMGEVYEAEQEHPARRVALKVIRPLLVSRALLRRFEFEAEVLGRMEHPGIASIYEAGSYVAPGGSPQPFFAMELVRGRALLEYAGAELGPRQRLELVARICDAVEYAHQKGVIHRDLKPGNVLVTADGQPKILDFGVARITDAEVRGATLETSTGQILGTLQYMSPEQASGDSTQIDTRTDVYALGAIAYELLVGRRPHDLSKKSLAEGVRLVQEQEPMRIGALDRRFRGDVETIVGKAMEKEKERRYAGASALAADIRRFLANEPIAARPPTNFYRLGKFVRRNKSLTAVATLVILVLIAGMIATRTQAVRARAAEQAQGALRKQAQAALDELRDTAPVYVDQARKLFAERKVDESLTMIDFAVRLRPESWEYHLLRAHKLEALERLLEAVGEYKHVLDLHPGEASARANLELCENLLGGGGDARRLSGLERIRLLNAITAEGRAEDVWPLQQVVGREAEAMKTLIDARLKQLMAQPKWNPDRLQEQPDGSFKLDLSDLVVTDLSMLRGLAISNLSLDRCPVSDLSALEGVPLRVLAISDTKVDNLRALSNAPLEGLTAVRTSIKDLSPLRDKPMAGIDVSETQVADISALRNARLEWLNMDGSQVQNLDVLSTMPVRQFHADNCRGLKDVSVLGKLPLLEEVVLSRCPGVTDLSSLTRCPKLKYLILPANYRDIAVLRRIPSLKRMSYTPLVDYKFTWENVPSSEITLAQIDRPDPQLRLESLRVALRRLGMDEQKVSHTGYAENGLIAVNLAGLPASDLSILAGLPIQTLVLDDTSASDLSAISVTSLKYLQMKNTKITDLGPLRGSPLEFLDLYKSPVFDLSPLAECRNLRDLRVNMTHVSNLRPVAGLPLTDLHIGWGTRVTDVSPLAGCATLERLLLPRNAKGIETLRKLPKLQRISSEFRDNQVALSAQEFWAEFDRKQKSQ